MNHWCHAYGTKVTGVTGAFAMLQPLRQNWRSFAPLDSRGRLSPRGLYLDLQHIPLTGYQFVEYWIDEESDEKPGDQAGDDDYGKRSLGV